MKNKPGVKTLIYFFAFVLIVSHLLYSEPVAAQNIGEPWTTPTNLSHSGSSKNPSFVTGMNGDVYAIWENDYSGTMYAKYDSKTWSQPVHTRFPFDPIMPELISNGKGVIYAFWISDQGRLTYSWVQEGQFQDPHSWFAPKVLANSALKAEASIDEQGYIHVLYITETSSNEKDIAPGVYYRQSSGSGDIWTDALRLYESSYLQGQSKENIDLVVGKSHTHQGDELYAAWTNQPRKQVLLVKSSDNGRSWDQPYEIDGPTSNQGGTRVFNLRLVTKADLALIVWETGEPEKGCKQYYRATIDAGASWSKSAPVRDQVAWCPEDVQPIGLKDGPVILLNTISGIAYLITWNGYEWSEPQSQEQIINFEDPDTLSQIQLGCITSGIAGEHEIAIMGCGKPSNDIWYATRKILDVSDWFPSSSNWLVPRQIQTGQEKISSPIIVPDEDGKFHAFWSQVIVEDGSSSRSAIFYSSIDEKGVVQPVVIRSDPDKDLEQPAVALYKNKMILAWREKQDGTIYISTANIENMGKPEGWSPPQAVPSPRPASDLSGIFVEGNGNLSVLFSIPINESRGIYLSQTMDYGKTWRSQVKIFDGVSAGWEIVGPSHLARTLDGHVHVVWQRYASLQDDQPMGLYYANSSDNGLTWSKPETVVDGSYAWAQMVGIGNTLHLLWQESNPTGSGLVKHQISEDGGKSWNTPDHISTFGELVGSPGLAADPAGQLHLMSFFVNNGNLFLRNQTWYKNKWSEDEGISIGKNSGATVQMVTGSVSSAGKETILYSSAVPEAESNPAGSYSLFFSMRSIELPDLLPTPAPQPLSTVVAAAPTLSPTVSKTSQPVSTSTPFAASGPDSTPASSGSPYMGVIVGGSVAGLLSIAMFSIWIFKLKRVR